MLQRQYYLDDQQHFRLLSAPNVVPLAAPDTQSAPYVTRAAVYLANYNLPRQFSNSMQAAPHQAYQSNPLYYSYQKTDVKMVYQVDGDMVKNQLKGFYSIFEEEGDNVTYLNKDFDKIAVNFVGIKTLCINYYATFPSRLKLHNHLKNSCLEMFSPAFLTQTASSILIITFKTVYQFFRFGLAFRG